MLDKFDALAEPYGFIWSLRDILPKVLVAGENAGTLTAEGARLLDTDGERKQEFRYVRQKVMPEPAWQRPTV